MAAAISEKGILISSISSWEIALLVKRGRLELAIDHRDWISKTQELPFVQFVPVDNLIALRSVELPGEFHADPADRIIAATAMTMAIPLMTCGQKIISYPHLQTIW
ncbi:type II toxin-antitoxin system VapC family toxin [Pelovirga terrestris]|uniref:type II toxin-antitoxin system VapC family toxin n=1 Tax=Pelovirga terrestris TaxID=2771352 RepID=UPI003B588379